MEIPKKLQKKLDEGRQYRSIDVREMRAAGEDGSYIVEGYATTFNQPYELLRFDDYVLTEQVDRHAFDETDMSDVIMQYDHEGRVFARVATIRSRCCRMIMACTSEQTSAAQRSGVSSMRRSRAAIPTR